MGPHVAVNDRSREVTVLRSGRNDQHFRLPARRREKKPLVFFLVNGAKHLQEEAANLQSAVQGSSGHGIDGKQCRQLGGHRCVSENGPYSESEESGEVSGTFNAAIHNGGTSFTPPRHRSTTALLYQSTAGSACSTSGVINRAVAEYTWERRLVIEGRRRPVSDRRTLGGPTQFLTQFGFPGSSTGP